MLNLRYVTTVSIKFKQYKKVQHNIQLLCVYMPASQSATFKLMSLFTFCDIFDHLSYLKYQFKLYFNFI
jgi:hypothetical protein